ncbi:MAG TPA: dihydrodipicolinate reductase C-terminal domain-containing protein, partial [Anaerovoracaceae bacterium]|nr:dihydrodipicolinate reductase C-terminal domain-containing protein [Anaerovoracaceae bacterium]
ISEMGIHSVRGGSIPGEHTVIFAGPDEVIELTHTVYSREVFAHGALKAAKFIVNKSSGLYSMEDMI